VHLKVSFAIHTFCIATILKIFSSKSKAMNQTLAKTENQYLVKRAVTWKQFKTLQSAFDEIGGVRMVYCEGELEIIGIGRLHEMTCALLGLLLGRYFMLKRIRFVATGAYTQELQDTTEFQSDLSYNFDIEKDISDLCIEIVVTSGSTKKLRKYQLLGVPEVWFWQNGKISIYRLEHSGYLEVKTSIWLPDLDISHLEQCLLMDSQLDAMTTFEQNYAS
jgi:Uma2 family endonuclease